MHQPPPFLQSTRDGFTMVEALVSIAVTALAGSVLLMGTSASLETTNDALQRTIAYGMAQQLMDEVVGCRYMDLGGSPYGNPIGPSASEAAAGTRQAFDDIGDFNGYRCQPPKDPYGIALGIDDGQGGQRNAAFQLGTAYLQNWQQQIDVFYVSGTNLTTPLPANQTSDYRVVQVRIVYNNPNSGPTVLASLQCVVTYVAPLSVN